MMKLHFSLFPLAINIFLSILECKSKDCSVEMTRGVI